MGKAVEKQTKTIENQGEKTSWSFKKFKTKITKKGNWGQIWWYKMINEKLQIYLMILLKKEKT